MDEQARHNNQHNANQIRNENNNRNNNQNNNNQNGDIINYRLEMEWRVEDGRVVYERVIKG